MYVPANGEASGDFLDVENVMRLIGVVCVV